MSYAIPSILFFFFASAVAANADELGDGPISISGVKNTREDAADLRVTDFQGWDYLVSKLRAQGVPELEITRIYQDPRMPAWTEIPFKLKPKETHQMYSQFFAADKISLAREFLKLNKPSFDAAFKSFKVGKEVIAAILLIETHFGKVCGEELVVHRLSRMSAIAEPKNVLANYESLKRADAQVVFDDVEKRAKYIEDLFFPEIAALLEISKRYNIDIFSLKGSRAGAFGMPQFLPSTFLKLATDGNGDGTLSLFDEEDAIPSVANFLASFGWSDNAAFEEKKKILMKYNNSEAYVDAVLRVAKLLGR